jgi:hypothetical protein
MYSIPCSRRSLGLPVIQRLDPDNIDQIKVGVNGYLFNQRREIRDLVLLLNDKTPEERAELSPWCRIVRERGSDSIAKFMLDLYVQAIEKKSGGARAACVQHSEPLKSRSGSHSRLWLLALLIACILKTAVCTGGFLFAPGDRPRARDFSTYHVNFSRIFSASSTIANSAL